jgi:hypothetical protein
MLPWVPAHSITPCTCKVKVMMATTTSARTCKGKNFSQDEEHQLCWSYLHVSQDHHQREWGTCDCILGENMDPLQSKLAHWKWGEASPPARDKVGCCEARLCKVCGHVQGGEQLPRERHIAGRRYVARPRPLQGETSKTISLCVFTWLDVASWSATLVGLPDGHSPTSIACEDPNGHVEAEGGHCGGRCPWQCRGWWNRNSERPNGLEEAHET